MSLIVINNNVQFNVSMFSHCNFIHIINEILFNFRVTKIFGYSLYSLDNTFKTPIPHGKTNDYKHAYYELGIQFIFSITCIVSKNGLQKKKYAFR